jgi:tetratricopeptide (TPR) repeat protein
LDAHPDSPRFRVIDAALKVGSSPGEVIERQLKDVIEQVPGEAFSWGVLGTFYLSERRVEEGILALEKAMELDPDNPEILKQLAIAYVTAQRYDEAARVARRTLALDPRNVQTSVLLVYALIYSHHEEEARDYALFVAEAEDASTSLRLMMLPAYLITGDPDRAIDVLRKLFGEPNVLADTDARAALLPLVQIFARSGYGDRVLEAIEHSGRTEELRPLYEALRIHISGKRSQLRRLSPELRQPVTAILDQWKDLGSRKTQPKQKRKVKQK